jgi:hypothetical protein
MARAGPSMSRPQRNIPTACIGLFADRGNTAAAGSPTASTTSPSGASATTEPVWRLSTNPDRTTSADAGRGTMGSSVSRPIPRRGAGQRRRPHHRSSGGDLRTALVHDLLHRAALGGDDLLFGRQSREHLDRVLIAALFQFGEVHVGGQRVGVPVVRVEPVGSPPGVDRARD